MIDESVLTVRVVDYKGSPISGATVECVNMEVPPISDTDLDGFTYIFIQNDAYGIYSSLIIFVSAPGYVSIEQTIQRTAIDTYGNGNSVEVELMPTSDTTYYTICTRESEDASTVISGATVHVYNDSLGGTSETTLTTNSNGTCLFETTFGSYVYSITVSKNGYVTREGIVLDNGKTSISASGSSPKYVDLDKSVSLDYYFVTCVKDQNSNPVPGVMVRMFSDFSLSSPWVPLSRRTEPAPKVNLKDSDITSAGAKELFVRVQTVLSNVSSKEISTIKASDVFSNYNQYYTQIINSTNSTFHTEITEQDLIAVDSETNRPVITTVGDFVELVRTKIPDSQRYKNVYKTVYETDENGKIVIERGTQNNVPNSIYAKCTSLPETGYEWVNYAGPYDVLPATTERDTIGVTFTINSLTGSTYYHNFQFIDYYSMKPIQGISVEYKNGDEVLEVKESNENGYSLFSCNLQHLDIRISKSGYNTYRMPQSEGSDDPNDIYTITIRPQNSIRVIYDNHHGEQSRQPVPGIDVEIFYRDDSGNNISKGIYTTNENGYIDTLHINVYSSGGKYTAVVINYEAIYPEALTLYIAAGENVIELPPEGSPDEDTYDYKDFNDFSVNGIKKHIRSNKVSYNTDERDYKINIVDPDSITVYDIFSGEPVMMNDTKKDVIGSINVSLKKNLNELRLKMINRYSGYYNPIFKDVLFYNNFKPSDEVDECVYSNTSFDDTYEDNYGKFGIINNMWFHKVNDENKEIITSLEPYYPLTGQYALDYRDYNIFESNWDKDHYTKQVDISTSTKCLNISSMKEGLCMFGSKYLNVPEVIEIYGFTLGNDSEWKGEWNDNWITNQEGCPGEIMFKEINDNSVDFYLFMNKRIIRYFKDKLFNEFKKFVADEYSFGRNGIDDDIEEYVKKNILKLYKIEKVRMFVKRNRIGQHNSRIENDYTTYLEYDKNCTDDYDKNYFKTHNLVEYFRQHNFIEVNNITMTKMNRDDFDRKIVYNLQSGYEEKFGFSFILRKI